MKFPVSIQHNSNSNNNESVHPFFDTLARVFVYRRHRSERQRHDSRLGIFHNYTFIFLYRETV